MRHLCWTPCRDGVTVSTISRPVCCGGGFETALVGGLVEVVVEYETPAAAFSGHARYVRDHGGADLTLWQRLFG